MVFVSVVLLIVGFVDAPRLDRAPVCRDGEHRNCLVGHQGRVLAVNGSKVTVEFDDGREVRHLELRGDTRPPVRAFVRIEFWGRRQNAVAIVDSHGRRFKDRDEWPVRWDRTKLAVASIGASVIGLTIVVARVRRRRRR
jgi:hypothetical protein